MLALNLLKQLERKLAEYQKALVVIPTPHDLDGVVSSIVWANFLEQLNIQTSLISRGILSDYFQPFLSPDQLISNHWPNLGLDSLVFLLDTPSLRHSGFSDQLKQINSDRLIVIDHHPLSDLQKIAGLNLSSSTWSSTAEAVAQIITDQRQIKKLQACWLMLAMIADTSHFQFNTRTETLLTASRLLRSGADLPWINQFLNQQKMPLNKLRLWGKVSANLFYFNDWQLALAIVTREELTETESTDEDVSGLANFLIKQNISSLVILLVESEDNQIKGFIRSSDKKVSAQKIAQIFGGDGLDRAAGFILAGKFVKKDKKIMIE